MVGSARRKIICRVSGRRHSVTQAGQERTRVAGTAKSDRWSTHSLDHACVGQARRGVCIDNATLGLLSKAEPLQAAGNRPS